MGQCWIHKPFHLTGFFIYFFLEVTVDLQCCVNFCCTQSDSVIHIYTILFHILFQIMVYHVIMTIVPCAISRTLLLIHSIGESLHLLIPNSTLSLSYPSPPWQPQVSCLCILTFLKWRLFSRAGAIFEYSIFSGYLLCAYYVRKSPGTVSGTVFKRLQCLE